MARIFRLVGARQAGYGIETSKPTSWITLRESWGEVDLSVEYGRASEHVGDISDDATYEEMWTALALLEKWPKTYAEQEADRQRAAEEEGWAYRPPDLTGFIRELLKRRGLG